MADLSTAGSTVAVASFMANKHAASSSDDDDDDDKYAIIIYIEVARISLVDDISMLGCYI